MSSAHEPASAGRSRGIPAPQVIVVSSVMFTFISYWRTAAIVFCDLGSTAYYIGGIVEQSIGAAAPWFILAVMLFSYAVRSVYIESCSLFVRGGVYRVVKEAVGGFPARVAVSALMFDYILTGPISGVSAGQYIIGLVLETFSHFTGIAPDDGTRAALGDWGSILIACLITVYFFRQNLLGIQESSGKALRIMIVASVMVVVLLAWCGLTLVVDGPRNSVPPAPDLTPKMNPVTHDVVDPLGFLGGTRLGESLRGVGSANLFHLIGLVGLCIAFGHSILAMSGEETLAQVYREVEAPKLANFKKAAFIVFLYSLVLTAGVSFLAVLLIPDDVRMRVYSDNLIGGLAMNVIGPIWARLLLHGFVVLVGFLILAGAVNTAMIGSNGVLNRVAEDGVLPAWFQKPHPRYGTSYRILYLILALQLFTVVASRGHVIILGEAYAFGVVWSFVFMSMAMLVLRFRRTIQGDFKVPGNLRLGRIELPLGLGFVFLILVVAAVANLLTKETATMWGIGFTAFLLTVFSATEYLGRRRRGSQHQHLEQFNHRVIDEVGANSLGLAKPYRKLVAIRSPNSMYMLERSLAETDPETTDLVVMTAKLALPDDAATEDADLNAYDRQLMTAVVERAELAGKQVRPLIVVTNAPLFAILRTAAELEAQEVVLGTSNKYTAQEQLDHAALYWLSIHEGRPTPLTVRIVSPNRDLYFDLGGGARIPKISERQARSVAELRAAGFGVDRVLLLHDGTSAGSDLFHSVLTMLDPQVALTVVRSAPSEPATANGNGRDLVEQDRERARDLRREVEAVTVDGEFAPGVVATAKAGRFDLIILPLSEQWRPDRESRLDAAVTYILTHSGCRVLLAAPPSIPDQTDQ
ncbi:MAG: amino acid permease [Thermogutta sp.]|nr:amino acid permease [Thermogutta sp.]